MPNGAMVARVDALPGYWFFAGEIRDGSGQLRGSYPRGEIVDIDRLVVVKLTVAHLNHTAGDDRDENLAALCQGCHLRHDVAHHKDSRATRKDAARPLLAELLQDKMAWAEKFEALGKEST